MSDPAVKDPVAVSESARAALEVAALEFRDCAARLRRQAQHIRWTGGPEFYAVDAEKIAADLSVVEESMWRRIIIPT